MANNLKRRYQISQREGEILNILWESQEPLFASQIAKHLTDRNEQLSINTVQSAVKNMLKKNLVEVADIQHSGTVLSRRYRPVLSKSDFLSYDLLRYYKEIDKNISAVSIISALLDCEEYNQDLADALEKYLREKQKS
ncbi:MAG: BlaI/MecI/CopY family transcriptional regulator [Clostridiales bacterium]|jgi:predicted transcriptional regulator|nr:BlaI/MecI/CopY family transcriptional regulator [Clostridiales bacterium]